MFRLTDLEVVQFKNYTNRSFHFDERIISISGKNGVGKTNILDAIHYLSFTKSYFTTTDHANVQHGTRGFRIRGLFDINQEQEEALCILRENGKKEFSVNQQPYDKFSQHIGRYPCVIVAPDDAILISGTSDKRRFFLDTLLSQFDSTYLNHLIFYNKILLQRNSFLKNAAEKNHLDEKLLQVLDEQLIPHGEFIFEKRKNFLTTFLPQVRKLYVDIARQEEPLTLLYESKLLEHSFAELLQSSRQRDQFLQRTTCGIHRDDLMIEYSNTTFKNIASQGQRKSLLYALKLSELKVLTNEKKMAPLLLLDDVFEKLDEERIYHLLVKACVENEGQVFITDTGEERLSGHIAQTGIAFDKVAL